ncbi:MAG: 23S rRNA (adenine(2503)-C(2))-methyltransferase RlmN [Leptospirales bacterium]|nr:23S rRNA (adenine(2503)-C(2))-methyltransferase RlmN [Leptospirales bacterium]
MAQEATASGMRIVERQQALDGSARLLLELVDGARVEAVDLRPGRGRRTICVSSQAGCVLDCKFCATAALPFQRNLSVLEILDQARLAQASGEDLAPPVSNIVFMGMGEPFYNYESVIAAAGFFARSGEFALGERHVCISTAGVLPALERYFAEAQAFHLAISLCSAIDDLRSQLMPINLRYPLQEIGRLLHLQSRFAQKRLMLEIPLLAGVNDGPDDAKALLQFCAPMRLRINLIPWNPNPMSSQFAAPDRESCLRFQAQLRAAGHWVFIRRSLGAEVAGACGQLAGGSLSR